MAAAYYQGSAEQDKFRQVTVLNGNAAGVTAEALSRMSREVDGIYGTQSKAAEGLAILAGSGKIARDSLVEFTTMAVRMEDLAGRSIEQTSKELEQLGTKPAEASAKLNESYNYLTPAVYRQIRALEDQGKTEEAAALAQKTYSDAMSARAKQLEGELGYIERGWRGARDLAKEAWDAFLNIDRPTTVQDQVQGQIKALEEAIRRRKEQNANLGIKDGKATAEMEAQLENAKGILQLSASAGQATADAIDRENKRRQDTIDLQRDAARNASDAVKKQIELNQAAAKYKPLTLVAEDATAEEIKEAAKAAKDYATVVAGIEEKYNKKGGKGTGGIRVSDTEMASMRSQLAAARQYHQQLITMGSGATELNTAERESLKIGEQIKLATDAKTIARLKEKQSIADTLAAQLRSNEGLEQSYKAHQQAIDANYKDAQSIGQRARDQAAANEVFGKGRTAIEQMTLATLEHQLAEAEGSDSFDPKYIASLREKIAAQKDWVAALGQSDYKGVQARADELLRSAQAMGQSYREEAELSGMSAQQRQIIAAQRQVELRYAKEVAEVDKLNLGDAEKKAALDTLEQARLQELANAGAKVNLQVWSESVQQYDDVFRKGFADMLNNGKSGWEAFNTSLVTTFKTSVADQIYKAFAQPFIVPVIADIQGVIGSISGGNSASAASAVGNASSLISMGSRLADAIQGGFTGLTTAMGGWIASAGNYLGSTAMQGFGMGMQGMTIDSALVSTYGSSAASGAAFAPYVQGAAGIAGGVYGGRLISGGYSAWGGNSGNSAVNTGTAVGAAIGSIVPGIGTAIGSLVGGLLGGAVNRLFGRKLKDSGLEGDFGGDAGFTGQSFEYYKGGLFRSDKTKYNALDSETQSALAQQYAAIRDGAQGMAQVLGLGTDAIDGFTAHVKVSLKRLSESEASAALAAEFDKVSESLASAVLGTEDYTRQGETAVQALARLSGNLSAVNGVLGNLNSTLYASSLAGADMSSQLADLFGGLDQFGAATGEYFKAFYSAEEQRTAAMRALQQQLSSVDLTLPDINADNALKQWRDLADAQDLNTEAGRKAWSVLMQVSGAFADLTSSAASAAAQLRSSLTSLESKFAEGGRSIAYKAEDAIKQLQKAVGGSVIEADIPGLAQILRGATATQVEAYFREIWSTLSTDEARQQLIDFANGALDVVASDAAARTEAQKSAVDAAWSALQRSVAADRKIAEQSAQAASDLISEIGGAIDTLSNSVRSLYEEVDSTAAFTAEQGRAVISAALSSGILPAQDELSEAIGAITNGMQRTTYATQFDADRERLVLAGQLSSLKDAGDSQLSVAEQQLKAARDSLQYLDDMLAAGQAQLDALNGVTSSIDGGVLRVEDALSALTSAVLAAQSGKTSGGSYGGSAGGTYTDSVLKKIGDAWYAGDWITAQNYIRGQGISNKQLQDAFDLTQGDLQYLFNRGITAENPGQYKFQATDPMSVYAEAKAQGLTLSDVDKIIGANPGDSEAWAKQNGLPIYHSGTPYVPETGIALLQKGEAVLPQSLNPWAGPRMDTMQPVAGVDPLAGIAGALVQLGLEIKDMRTVLEAIERAAARTGSATAGSFDIMDRLTDGGTRPLAIDAV